MKRATNTTLIFLRRRILIANFLVIVLFINCKNTEEQNKVDLINNNTTERSNRSEFSEDFDFLIGEWDIHNKILKERLNDNPDEWIELDNTTTKVWKLLKGMAVIDEYHITINGENSIGSNYRFYNVETKEWTIYWASTAYSELGLRFQVRGFFDNGVGEFFGEEEYNGEKVKLRFVWKKDIDGNPYWEQAYYDEKVNDWETNWIMNFTRINS